ncbi:MAG: putative glycosyltransferase [Gemmatimonadetes bacterium]|nr:putative glycosyltransferase [Gemmatimonadota bacterium]
MYGPSADAPALSLIIPVYNAADQLPATLDAVETFVNDYPGSVEVVFVDDHSSEVETQLILEDFTRTRRYSRLLINERNRGKGFSVTRGMLAARGRHRVFTDVDLAYPLDQVHKIVRDLEAGADVAIACRVLPESRYLMSPSFFHYLYTRHLMSRAFNFVVQKFLLPSILDTQAGLKGFTADAATLCFSRSTIPGFGFDIECLYIAQQHGLGIKQTAVNFRYDDEPTTVRFARDSQRMFVDIWQVRMNAWRGQYSAANLRFVFPEADQWRDPVHLPPHGVRVLSRLES